MKREMIKTTVIYILLGIVIFTDSAFAAEQLPVSVGGPTGISDAMTSKDVQMMKDVGGKIKDQKDELMSDARAVDGVKTETICFSAHNDADPVVVPITGTLFHHGAYNPSSKVTVAVHGFGSDRSVWDGGPLSHELGLMSRYPLG